MISLNHVIRNVVVNLTCVSERHACVRVQRKLVERVSRSVVPGPCITTAVNSPTLETQRSSNWTKSQRLVELSSCWVTLYYFEEGFRCCPYVVNDFVLSLEGLQNSA